MSAGSAAAGPDAGLLHQLHGRAFGELRGHALDAGCCRRSTFCTSSFLAGDAAAGARGAARGAAPCVGLQRARAAARARTVSQHQVLSFAAIGADRCRACRPRVEVDVGIVLDDALQADQLGAVVQRDQRHALRGAAELADLARRGCARARRRSVISMISSSARTSVAATTLPLRSRLLDGDHALGAAAVAGVLGDRRCACRSRSRWR